MKIMRIIFILLIMVLFLSCNSEMKDSEFSRGKVIIEGEIGLTGDYSKVITLISPGPVETIRRTEIIDSAGNFRFEFDLIHPHDILIKYEKGAAQLFVRPLDSLFLSLSSDAFESEDFPVYRISGENAETLENILEYNRFEKLDNFQADINGDLSVTDYLKEIKQHIHKEDSLLSVFIGKYNPTKDFRTWAMKSIIYKNANYLIDYKYFHFMNKTKYSGDLFDKNIFPANDETALVSSLYGLHLWHYSTERYMQNDTVVRNLLGEDKLSEAYRICLNHIISFEEPGLCRDVMCYRILDALFEESYNDFVSLWKEEQFFIEDKELISMLQQKMERFHKQKNYEISMFNLQSQEEKEIMGDFWEILKKKYRGKVLYIDVWATWCGPCRTEIPYAIELHEYYKNKPIVFVNICMSSDRDAWKEAIKNEHISGDNYYFDKSQAQLFRSKMNFQGYPTYMILDKDGNVIDENAPRPSSDKQIKAKLEKLLEE